LDRYGWPKLYYKLKTNKDHVLLKLYELKPLISLGALLLDWLIIILAIYGHKIWPNAFVYLIAVIVIATRMQAIGVLVHDVVHYRFLNNRRLADWLGNLFMSWPLFFTIPGYRSMHLRHHSQVNTDLDPDWVRRKGKSDWIFPMGKSQFYKMLFFDLTGINFYQNLQKLFLPKSDDQLKKEFISLGVYYYVAMFGFYLSALGLIYYFNLEWDFLLYWLIPYFTVFKLIKRIRAIAEHFAIPDKKIAEITRTTLASPWEEFLFGQHNINYHVEHHRYPAVPWYHLKSLHQFLVSQGELNHLGHVSHGYIKGVLKEVHEYCQLNQHIK
jgi:fatty acid desaturase